MEIVPAARPQPPGPPFLRPLERERGSQTPGPAVSNIDSQHPWETGEISRELDQLHNLWIPMQNERVRPPG